MKPLPLRERLKAEDWDIITLVLGDAGGALLGVSLMDGTGPVAFGVDVEWSE